MSAKLELPPTPPRPDLFILVGPTAVGKTEIAVELAARINGEIISADSRLFYRGMDIGTAKPCPADLARAPHHLIDIADPDQTISLAAFQNLAHEAISGILRRGRLPLLVGGTGQYIRAVTAGWAPPLIPPNETMRNELTSLARRRGNVWLHDRLHGLDAAAAADIDPRNTRRIVRALEVILASGRRFSQQRALQQPPYSTTIIGLRRSRSDLYSRLDARIEAMWQHGLLDETRRLLNQGFSRHLPSMSAIGYAQCIDVIEGSLNETAAKAVMRRMTRAFVRRQANWFKETDPAITWFEASAADVVDRITAFVMRKLQRQS